MTPAVLRVSVPRFRAKLVLAMMLVVTGLTLTVLYFVDRNARSTVEKALRREFEAEVEALHARQAVRHAAIVERSQALARKSRIRAALEDGALDLLYPSARDELRDVMLVAGGEPASAAALRATFYRFLDRNGALIPPPAGHQVGSLPADAERKLALPRLPPDQQIGYITAASGDGDTLFEVFAMPIFSSETAEVIAALVLGFRPVGDGVLGEAAAIKSGKWAEGRLHLPWLRPEQRAVLERTLAATLQQTGVAENSLNVTVSDVPHLLFYKHLNPGSLYPAAYEVSLYPLSQLEEQQRDLRWRVVLAGAGMFLAGLVASHFLAGGFSRPVERLVQDSAIDHAARERAEAALQMTQEELQRSARFSADASHQLKTPVTVLRVGLEEMLARPNVSPEQANDLSLLIHQTYRLNSLIEDLLLLSRMDAGRLALEFSPVNLTRLIEAWLDDLSALPDPLALSVQADVPPALHVEGEKRYTSLILQNLLENARKYNRTAGRIHVSARREGASVILSIGNTGRTIPAEAQSHIFERFHRAAMGENIPGHGLGLNLAWELARLHRGELILAHSKDDWTEFHVRFRAAAPPGLERPARV